MQQNKNFLLFILLVTLSHSWFLLYAQPTQETNEKIIKVALREVGHQLLLSNKDSNSLVLPVQKLTNLQYQLTFQNKLAIEPDSLVGLFKNSFQKAQLPEHYLLEVIDCKTQEVVYSYKMQNTKEKSIIPCKGRLLPSNCYRINVQFYTNVSNKIFPLYFAIAIGGIFLVLLGKRFKNTPNATKIKELDETTLTLGSFLWMPNQNKLVLQNQEVMLSQKEGELLTILASQLNTVVKREELTKKVWEDKGVVVGRSLDTYISKLRKRLQEDSSIHITNVHGVGYKLGVEE